MRVTKALHKSQLPKRVNQTHESNLLLIYRVKKKAMKKKLIQSSRVALAKSVRRNQTKTKKSWRKIRITSTTKASTYSTFKPQSKPWLKFLWSKQKCLSKRLNKNLRWWPKTLWLKQNWLTNLSNKSLRWWLKSPWSKQKWLCKRFNRSLRWQKKIRPVLNQSYLSKLQLVQELQLSHRNLASHRSQNQTKNSKNKQVSNNQITMMPRQKHLTKMLNNHHLNRN